MKTGEPLYIEPQEYQDRRDSELREWGELIEMYEDKAEQAESEDEVEAYYEQVDALRARYEKARKMLQRLEASSGESWADLKASVDEAFEELESAIREATQRGQRGSSEA